MSKVAWDYIVPVKLPKDLKGIEPGKLPERLLRKVEGGGKLHHLASYAWEAMCSKAKSEGVQLKPTSSGDLYREYELQKRGFLSRYQLAPIPGQSTKTFEGKTWYLKKGMAMLATPGKSQHNLGLAVDIHSASEPKRLKWLIANVKEFGFSWEVVPSEPWHIRYVCGDDVPAAVLAFQGGAIPTLPAVAEEKAKAPVAPKSQASAPASNGDADKALQQALKDKGFYHGKIDGDIGPKTKEAIKAFKVKNGLKADGFAGPQVMELLGLK
jgi:hypothetical protein